MAAIDHANRSINDVIGHSLKLHPQLLVGCLRSHAHVHAEFADAYDDRDVTRNELDLAVRLHGFANAVVLGDHTIPDDADVRHAAFDCAARLQDLHPIMQSMIAEHENARNVRSGEDGCLVQQDSPDRGPCCEGTITTTGSWPFVERRRPGRANYTNGDLIAMLRGQAAKGDDPGAPDERDSVVPGGAADLLTPAIAAAIPHSARNMHAIDTDDAHR
jgi:hypothetical protein